MSRSLRATALVVIIAGLSACARPAEIPPREKEAINLGVNAQVGAVAVENLLLVTRAEGQRARLIGVLLNESKMPVRVELSDRDDKVSVALEPNEQYAFHEHPAVFHTADDAPGALQEVSIAVGTNQDSVRIPVRDGTLSWLKPYLP